METDKKVIVAWAAIAATTIASIVNTSNNKSQKEQVTQSPLMTAKEIFILPPRPGRENNVTIQGVDTNNDDVRDDIERWIYSNYPINTLARTALENKAKALMAEMFVGGRKVKNDVLWRIGIANIHSIDCIGKALGKDAPFANAAIDRMIVNTQQRKEAQQRFRRNVDSHHELDFGYITEINECEREVNISHDVLTSVGTSVDNSETSNDHREYW